MSEPTEKEDQKSHPVLLAVLVLYALLLAAAAASEILDLGWFDWLRPY